MTPSLTASLHVRRRSFLLHPLQAGSIYTNFNGCAFPCAMGYFGNSSSEVSKECSGRCPTGYVCPEGTSIPSACPPGHHLPLRLAGTSNHSCIPCSPGSFNAVPALGSDACHPCNAGTYSESIRSTACQLCAVGSSSDKDGWVGHTVCSLCLSFTAMMGEAWTGYYMASSCSWCSHASFL